MGSAQHEVKQEAAGKKKQQLQNGTIALFAILVVIFAIYAPPEYGVFVFVAILAIAAFIKLRKNKKEA